MPDPIPQPMDAQTQELLRRPNYAHLATIRPDGSPKMDPIWVVVEDPSTVLMTTSLASPKTQNLLRDPRCALSIIDAENPYEHCQIEGVATVEQDVAMAMKDEMSLKYTSAPFPMRDDDSNRVILRMTVTRSRYASMPLTHNPTASER